MDSPLLQPIPQPKRKVVCGEHITTRGRAIFTVHSVTGDSVHGYRLRVSQGPTDLTVKPTTSLVSADDLRELSALFAELADALEGK